MIQAKCIEKFRDKTGKIYGYRLIDLNEQTQDVTADNLKRAIANKKIHVINLTLTSDNRLVDSSEKQLQSKKLGPAPSKENIIKEVAKALAFLDKELVDMGDSFEEIVENLCYAAKLKFDSDKAYDDEKYADKLCIKAYEILLANNSHYSNLKTNINYYYEYSDTFCDNITCLSESHSMQIIRNIGLVAKYAELLNKNGKCDDETFEKIKELRGIVCSIDLQTSIFGNRVGNTFFRYLDEKYFGTRTNDAFTVGNVLTKDDENRKLGAYVINARMNILGMPNDCGFTVGLTKTNNGIQATFYHYTKDNNNHEMKYTGFTNNSVVFNNTNMEQSNIEAVSKQIAFRLNKLAELKYNKLAK